MALPARTQVRVAICSGKVWLKSAVFFWLEDAIVFEFIGCTFIGCTFIGCTFIGSKFIGSKFIGSKFIGSKFIGFPNL
ncbi:pentapeptide repeat-containing protein [Psychrobacter sp. G]|uniref:pentapeptide repeat-containing protein n=1 Tax=Psychrobacter sp. G TaxID=571800 RepID=UPI001D0CE662